MQDTARMLLGLGVLGCCIGCNAHKDGGADPAHPGEVLWRGTTRWGRLRDSDPFVGAFTGTHLPNWSVAFEMDVPL